MADPSLVAIPAGWELRGKPPTLFRRFEFPRYAATRDFLDALAALSEETAQHPENINFGATYVNVSLEIADAAATGAAPGAAPGAASSAAQFALAARINALYPAA